VKYVKVTFLRRYEICQCVIFMMYEIRLDNNNKNEKFILRHKMQKQTQGRRSLHISKTYDQHLEACCKGISSCSHRVIGIATYTSMVLNCAFVTYIRMTADVGLPDAV